MSQVLLTIGWKEILVVLAVCLLLFGNRIPNLMRNLGRGVTGFKKGLQEGQEDDSDDRPGGGR